MGIDLEKYEGHTPGPWRGHLSYQWVLGPSGVAIANFNFASAKQENVSLIEDAPALLAEVVRLRADLAEAVELLRRTSAEMTASGWAACDGVHSDIIDAIAKHGGGK